MFVITMNLLFLLYCSHVYIVSLKLNWGRINKERLSNIECKIGPFAESEPTQNMKEVHNYLPSYTINVLVKD